MDLEPMDAPYHTVRSEPYQRGHRGLPTDTTVVVDRGTQCEDPRALVLRRKTRRDQRVNHLLTETNDALRRD